MSQLTNRALMALVAVPFVVTATTRTVTGRVQSDRLDVMVSMQEVIRAGFPELTDRGLEVQGRFGGMLDEDRTTDGFATLLVLPNSANSSQAITTRDEMLRASFVFRNGELKEVTFDGRYANDVKAEALRKEAESHTEWNDGDMARALTRMRAAFAMDDADSLIRAREVSRFDAVFGPTAVRSAVFKWRIKSGDAAMVHPTWLVSLAKSPDAAGADCVVLFYSPVLARLTRLSTAPCDSLTF